MTDIKSAFEHGKAFIPFVTAGDPDLETTAKLLVGMSESGADIIEIGIPFSDPIAEGVVIQEADLRSLFAGTTTDKIFDMVKEIRQNTQIPLVFMTYANVVFSYGTERFLEKAKNVEMDGLILPDVSEERMLLFDEELISFTMGNCITLEDTNGNRKLYKQRRESKIDAVAAMMDAYVAYKANKDCFD